MGRTDGFVPPPATSYRYPSELICEVETADGGIVQMRPIRPDDGRRLSEFHERLSLQSVYRRFFFVHPKLSSSEVDRFTHVDYVNRLALVVVDGDRLVAVGRYDRTSGTSEAEVAFVVADDFQHRGIGTLLLEHLADAAVENGITTFVAQTLAENHDMLDVFKRSGFHVISSSEYDTVAARFSIEPDESYRLACATRHGHAAAQRRHRLEDRS